MFNNLKSATALAAITSLVNLLEAPVVTEEMIKECEVLMGPCPPEIREHLLSSNFSTDEKVPQPEQSKADAAVAAVEAIRFAMDNGGQITPDMIAAVEALDGQPCPPDVLMAIAALNGLHALGIDTGKLADDDTLCGCPACVAEREGASSKPNTFVKSRAIQMSDEDENDFAMRHVKELIERWKSDPEIPATFPVLVAAGILHAYAQIIVDVNTQGRWLLKSIDTTRAACVDALGIEA